MCLMTLLTRAAKELGGFPERHEWAKSEVGEGSTRRMTYRQMSHCIEQLKYLLGERPRPPQRYWYATTRQLRAIKELAALVPWRVEDGLIRFVKRELSELRKRTWDGMVENLSRREATKVIEGLRGLAAYESGTDKMPRTPAERSSAEHRERK